MSDVSGSTGFVKSFNNAKGYGFVANDAGGPDLFVHFSSIIADGYKSLNAGDHVGFDIGEDRKGKPAAINVRVVKPAAYKSSASIPR